MSTNLVEGKSITFSIWLRVKDVSELTYKNMLQFRTYTSSDTGISYWEHRYDSNYSNKPTVVDNKWVRVEFANIPWSTILSKSTFYDSSYDSSDSAQFRIRLVFIGNGEISYKLPCLYIE